MRYQPLVKVSQLPATPINLFARIAHRPYSFLLDSNLYHPHWGRYTIMGQDPFLVLSSRGQSIVIQEGDRQRTVTADPLLVLRQLLLQYQLPPQPDLPPFWGGAVGCFSYDLGRQLERIPQQAVDDLGLPDLIMGFYDTVAIVDHQSNQLTLIATGLPRGSTAVAYQRLQELEYLLHQPPVQESASAAPVTGIAPQQIVSNFSREQYCEIVERAKAYIAAGDIFQVNISQRFSAPLFLEPFNLYRRLRQLNPAPYAAYFNYPDCAIASSSPELFLRCTGDGHVVTRPIKGTRPRGLDPAADRKLKHELWQSPKDRAELIMIIDLERNDLGRVCQAGSIKVPRLMQVEEFATVFHLVSTVTGQLAPGMDAIDLMRATFPGGSITGAPKIRAMEIIEELEPVRRGFYTGSIGYLGWQGNADLNIAIRTMVTHKNQVFFQLGGGIVTDSDPELEYEETLHKGKALFQSLQQRPAELLAP